MYKAVFFDRDGVINKSVVIDGKPYPPSDVSNLEILQGVEEGILELRAAGFKIFIVTNQPDVARGKTDRSIVENIHNFILKKFNIDEIECCFHDDTELCDCRKPQPGMILRLASKWHIDLTNSFLVGDRWRDIKAAKNAGVISILIDYQYKEKQETPDYSCKLFTEAINFILNHNKPL
jgi:D-glycero-D-manno-heptose 1,7-bisphosphate phosphatase